MSMREGTRRKKISVLHMLGTWEERIEGCNCPSCKEYDAGEKSFLAANKSPPKSPKGPKKISIKVKTAKDVAKISDEGSSEILPLKQILTKQSTLIVSKLPVEFENSSENLVCSNENEHLCNSKNTEVIGSNSEGKKQSISNIIDVEEIYPHEKEQPEEIGIKLGGEEVVGGGNDSEVVYKEECEEDSAPDHFNSVSAQKKAYHKIHNSLDKVTQKSGNREKQSSECVDLEDTFKIKQEPEEYFSDEEVIEKNVKRKHNVSSVREARSSKRAKMVTSEIENVYAKPRMIFTGRGVVRKFEPGLDRTPKSRRGRKPGKATMPVKVKQEPKDTEGPENECEEEEGSDLDQLQRALSEAAENISDVGEEFFNAFNEFGEDPKKGGRPKRRANPLFKRVDSDGDKYVECNMCFKMLKESSMKQHYKTHTGEKPHTCNECDSRFTRKGDVERHKRLVHKNQKPYKCQKCNREFSDIKNIKAHLQNHDKAIYYACNTCGFKFGKREYYENHIRYIHPLSDGSIPAFTDTDEDLATKQLKQIEMEEKREQHSDNIDMTEDCDLIPEDEDESEASEKAMEITVHLGEEQNATSSSSLMVKKEHESISTMHSQDEEFEDQGTSLDSGRGSKVAACLVKPEVGTDVKISKGTLSFTQTVPDTDSQDEDLVNKVIAAAVIQATNTIESLQAKSGGNMSGNDVDLVDNEEEEEDEMLEGAEALQEILDSTTYDMLPIPQVQKQTQQPIEVHINASVSGQQRKFIIQVPSGTNLNVQTPEGMEMIVSIVNQLCAGRGELDGPIEVTMHNPNNRMVVMKKS